MVCTCYEWVLYIILHTLYGFYYILHSFYMGLIILYTYSIWVLLQFASAEMVEKAIEEYDGAEIVLTQPKEGEEQQEANSEQQEGSVLKLSKMIL